MKRAVAAPSGIQESLPRRQLLTTASRAHCAHPSTRPLRPQVGEQIAMLGLITEQYFRSITLSHYIITQGFSAAGGRYPAGAPAVRPVDPPRPVLLKDASLNEVIA